MFDILHKPAKKIYDCLKEITKQHIDMKLMGPYPTWF